MKYFLHDTSASDDEKITELFIEFGYEGIGLFYTLLEKIGKQEKPIKTTVLKTQLKVTKRLEKCWEFLHTIGLVSSNNGETFNERILSYNQMYQVKKEKNREKITEWRKNQADKKNVTSYEPECNQPKEKVLKGKVIKGNNNTAQQAAEPLREIVLPWNSIKFLESWKRWKDYKKKQHRFVYKSEDTEQAALMNLSKLSAGFENTAVEIINQSIANGWSGLFEIKLNHNGKQSTIYDQREGLKAELSKRFGDG